MAIADKLLAVAEDISGLIGEANDVTGAGDTTLTDAVQTLCDGYGQGGGGKFITAKAGIDHEAVALTSLMITAKEEIE